MTNETASNSAEFDRHLWERRYELVQRVRISIHYHALRARFLDLTDKNLSALTAVTSTGAVVTLLNQATEAATLVGVVAAVASMLQLVFSPSQSAKRHSDLVGDFRRLLCDFEAAGEHWTEDQCNGFSARCIGIEVGEPPALGGVVAVSQNLVAQADGATPCADVKPWHFFVMHLFNVHPRPLESRRP